MTWYCKANFKTDPLRLEIKKEELCLYSFKYINCKDKYQANSNDLSYAKSIVATTNYKD